MKGLPFLDAYRTLFVAPPAELERMVLLAEFQVGYHAGPNPGELDHDSVSALLLAGEYYLLAEADPLRQLAEAVEKNLRKLRVVVR